MSGFMLHALGDCSPEQHCGCLDAPTYTDLRDEVERLRTGIKDAADDLIRELTASIPLNPPDHEWDPNDEFRRCAVNRAERAKRWRDRRITPLLNSTEKSASTGPEVT